MDCVDHNRDHHGDRQLSGLNVMIMTTSGLSMSARRNSWGNHPQVQVSNPSYEQAPLTHLSTQCFLLFFWFPSTSSSEGKKITINWWHYPRLKYLGPGVTLGGRWFDHDKKSPPGDTSVHRILSHGYISQVKTPVSGTIQPWYEITN